MLASDDEVRLKGFGRSGIRPLAVELLKKGSGERERAIRLDGLEALAEPAECGQRGRRERGQRASVLGRWGKGQTLHRPPDRHGGAQRIHR